MSGSGRPPVPRAAPATPAPPAPPATPATPAAPLRALVEELVRAGVRDVVVCPGSRSTPLALALRAEPAIRTWLHLDERAGAYLALGIAKATHRPSAILGTSGTAVVNMAPAVVEARQGRVPLIVLTADRPPELRDRGAPQTIDQDHLFGRFAKWFVELPVPESGPVAAGGPADLVATAHLRGVVGRAVATALEPPAGPVQLNLPFREPLVPAGDLRPGRTDEGTVSADGRAAAGAPSIEPAPYVRLAPGRRVLDEPVLDGLVERLAVSRRPLIVCGPLDAPGFGEAVARLAGAIGAPILADALANVRLGPHDRSHVVVRHDAIVRWPAFRDAHQADLVVRFGATPTSKALLEMMREQGAPQVVVDDGGWTEPTLLAATIVHADPVWLAAALAERFEQHPDRPERAAGPAADETAPEPGPTGAWLEDWLAADRAADEAIRAWLAGLDEPFEGAAFSELEGVLPDGTILYAGNSMPVRDLDAFLAGGTAAVRCLANRGANGIDGVVSAALGAATAAPLVLVVGDVSFIHDLNALVGARLNGISATIVLIDNDGGGIFSFLPQATTERPGVGLPEHFEELFGTPHGIDLGPIVAALGGEHRRLGPGQIGPAVRDSLGRPGVRVLELRTERRRNVELHRSCQAAVGAALEPLGRRLRGTGR
ncbi:MAG: 2-succinyl-5-enolpyruvyl-6-hydroxy-3-cyclohexene-1-carboxylic-acid synthase [Chloroflexota bacterium]